MSLLFHLVIAIAPKDIHDSHPDFMAHNEPTLAGGTKMQVMEQDLQIRVIGVSRCPRTIYIYIFYICYVKMIQVIYKLYIYIIELYVISYIIILYYIKI